MTSRAESVRKEMAEMADVISAHDVTQGISAIVRVQPLGSFVFVTNTKGTPVLERCWGSRTSGFGAFVSEANVESE